MSRHITIMSGLMIAVAVFGQEPIELDPSCMVTVGYQTAIVRPDRSFPVRNISVFRSRTTGIAPQVSRVRATFVSDGQTITGQSEFVELKPGADHVHRGRISHEAGSVSGGPTRVRRAGTGEGVSFA